jgi:hypothetical protein
MVAPAAGNSCHENTLGKAFHALMDNSVRERERGRRMAIVEVILQTLGMNTVTAVSPFLK